jgi:hypothetical protein
MRLLDRHQGPRKINLCYSVVCVTDATALRLLMLEAVHTDLVFTISRSAAPKISSSYPQAGRPITPSFPQSEQVADIAAGPLCAQD